MFPFLAFEDQETYRLVIRFLEINAEATKQQTVPEMASPSSDASFTLSYRICLLICEAFAATKLPTV